MGFDIYHNKNVTVADWSGVVTVPNSTGGTTTMQASDLARPSDWNSVHSLGRESGYFEPHPWLNTGSTLMSPGIGTWYIDPLFLPHGLDSGQLNVLMVDAAGFLGGTTFSQQSSGSVTRYQTLSNVLALYSRGTGASTTRLESFWSSAHEIRATWERRWATAGSTATLSNYLTLSYPSQFDVSGNVTYGSTSTSGTRSTSSSTSGGTAPSSFGDSLISGLVARISGSRFQPFGLTRTLAPDNYWLGHMYTSTSSSTGTNYSAGTMIQTQSRIFLVEVPTQSYKLFGQTVSNTSSIAQGWHGSVATTSSAPISTLATSDLRNLATNNRMYWNYQKTTY